MGDHVTPDLLAELDAFLSAEHGDTDCGEDFFDSFEQDVEDIPPPEVIYPPRTQLSDNESARRAALEVRADYLESVRRHDPAPLPEAFDA